MFKIQTLNERAVNPTIIPPHVKPTESVTFPTPCSSTSLSPTSYSSGTSSSSTAPYSSTPPSFPTRRSSTSCSSTAPYSSGFSVVLRTVDSPPWLLTVAPVKFKFQGGDEHFTRGEVIIFCCNFKSLKTSHASG